MPLKRPDKLRIGYFSADYGEHPVAYLIAKVLEQHNRDEFEVFGYSLRGNQQVELRQRLINSFDRFVFTLIDLIKSGSRLKVFVTQ